MRFLLILLVSMSCAHQNSRLSPDQVWLHEQLLQINNPILLKIYSKISTIEVSDHSCDPGQIACTKFIFPNTIYLTSASMKMRQSMRASTLLHEAAHHYYHYYSHSNCNNQSGYNCDYKWESSYGAEVLFYQGLIQLNPKNIEYAQEYELLRVNLQIK